MTSMKKRTKRQESVEQYTHRESKRTNNPHAGLVTSKTDPDKSRKKYTHDPRLDPQLIWSTKNEKTELRVDTVSLHVHERIDPHTILEKVMKTEQYQQKTIFNFFDLPENNPPLRNAIEFYKHDQNWSNRLIAGDSLLVMNSLLEKENMTEKVQMIYMDPPYGIKYGSNFQPFVNKKNVADGVDADLTQEPETIKAYRDTWELGIHSYLSYLRDRLILSKQLLGQKGSIFVQISDENIHHVRELLDEIFGVKNFVSVITFRRKMNPLGSKFIGSVSDYLIWYAKNKKVMTFNRLFKKKELESGTWNFVEEANGTRRKLTSEELQGLHKLPKNVRVFTSYKLAPAGVNKGADFEVTYRGKKYQAPYSAGGRSWVTNEKGMMSLVEKNRVIPTGNTLRFVKYYDDFPFAEVDNLWNEMALVSNKIYAVQTATGTIQRCILMTTEPGDLVFDPTCGSGTTAFVAEQQGRRWITCDTSRVAIYLAKQRLMTSRFEYYKLNQPQEGVKSGFKYATVPHITLGALANNEPINEEILYDAPVAQKNLIRISGPFTVEAVPAPTVKSIDVLTRESKESKLVKKADSHQQQWREELFKTGIRGKNNQKIEFVKVESHPATKWLHADAETKEKNPKRVMISFGPEYAPLESRQVENAINEAQKLVPKPEIIIFVAMQFDPEASKDIDELKWPETTILKAEINKDLLTKDLKRKRASNESFWLMGQPDVKLEKIKNKKYVVAVKGFDYYDTRDGQIKSGNVSNIAMWMLDEDYDGRSIYPQQVFFPLKEEIGGWTKLAKTLQAHIDEELIVKYQGTKSIPFEAGQNKQAAVKIIDDRGIESLKIIPLEQ